MRNLRNFRARPTAARPQFNQVARRTYASGGHGEAKSGGDAVWYVYHIPTDLDILERIRELIRHALGLPEQ